MSAPPLLRWLSSSVADSVGRMMLQFAATLLFARRLGPEVFGQAALVMVAAGTLSVFVTAPFEEALAQRRRVRSRHFAAALGVVLLAGIALALLAPLLAFAVEGTGALAPFALILLANGPAAVLTALCRRQRRFGLIAFANSGGQLVGTAAGLLLVFAFGAGVWGLLAVQLVGRYANLAILVAGSPVRVRPGWSPPHLRELARFAGWHLAGRCVEAFGDALYQFLVGVWFGISANGYLNMAMRVVEPIRGASGAIGHNLATAFFAPAQAQPERLRMRVASAIDETALLLLPVFIGLAVVAPALIAVLAGPAWSPAAPLAICLALGAAFGVVANLLHSALAAGGRAEIGFIAGLLDVAVVVATLLLLRERGLIAVGIARLLPYATDLALVTALSQRVLGLPDAPLLRSLTVSLGCAVLMAVAASAADRWAAAAGAGAGVHLAGTVAAGVLTYAAAAVGLQGRLARRLRSRVMPG